MEAIRQVQILTVTGAAVTIIMGCLFCFLCDVQNKLIYVVWPALSSAVFLSLFLVIKRTFLLPVRSVVEELNALLRKTKRQPPETGLNEWTAIRLGIDAVAIEIERMQTCHRDMMSCRDKQRDEFDKLIDISSQLERSLRTATEDATNLKLVGEEMNQDAVNIVDVSKSSSDISKQGVKYVEMSKNAMTEIRASEQGILESNDHVSEYINEINEIIVMVSGISAQSTMLAINASIQAARAGDAGRAFSVVAREMKTLSVDSKLATKRASEIIQNIKSAISQMQQHVEEGRNRTQRGTDILNKTEETISHLGSIIKEMSGVANMIATSAKEQSYGLESVDQSIDRLHKISVEHRMELRKQRDELSSNESLTKSNNIGQNNNLNKSD